MVQRGLLEKLDDYKLLHTASTSGGSSGAPILTKTPNPTVIGIHLGAHNYLLRPEIRFNKTVKDCVAALPIDPARGQCISNPGCPVAYIPNYSAEIHVISKLFQIQYSAYKEDPSPVHNSGKLVDFGKYGFSNSETNLEKCEGKFLLNITNPFEECKPLQTPYEVYLSRKQSRHFWYIRSEGIWFWSEENPFSTRSWSRASNTKTESERVYGQSGTEYIMEKREWKLLQKDLI